MTFSKEPPEITEREILKFLASVYDPLGLISPTFLLGKIVSGELCDDYLSWDEKLSESCTRPP